MFRLCFSIILLFCAMTSVAEIPDSAAIRRAVESQMSIHPESSLCDIYKFFYQDRFGPGHLLSDRDMARKYLVDEMSRCDTVDSVLFEPTGAEANFIRVNLSLVRDSIVPFDTFFDAFIQSVASFSVPDPSLWKEEWQAIDAVIKEMNLTIEGQDGDREKIAELFESATSDLAVHHSRRFNQLYHPHYRIISTSVFVRMILPLLRFSSLSR